MSKDLKALQGGREFQAKEVIEAKTSYLREKTKARIATTVLGGVAIALSFGLYESLREGTYQPVRDVWLIVSNLLFLVIGLYFGKKLRDGEGDDTSTT